MALKVLLPAEKLPVLEGSLYQWDYGRVLEIECEEIGSEIVELHFACQGMPEAIVCLCTFSNSVGTVTIPNQCLEQTRPITVWIYKIEGTEGQTIKTFTLPITARTRPSKAYNIPTEYDDIYAQAVTKIDEAINDIEKGNVKAANAIKADNADYATSAGNAESASYATSAGNANTANTASIACGLKYTKVFGGSHKEYEILSQENFIKSNRRYVVCFGGVYYTGYSDALGNTIQFSGNDIINEGAGNNGILWNGIIATAGLIKYTEGTGVMFDSFYMMFICHDGATIREYASTMGYEPKVSAIYECEAIDE